jgi:hypothetical protein
MLLPLKSELSKYVAANPLPVVGAGVGVGTGVGAGVGVGTGVGAGVGVAQESALGWAPGLEPELVVVWPC